MKNSAFSRLVGLGLLAVPVMGQNTSFFDGLVTALEAANLNISTTLAAALSLNQTSQGAAAINQISSGAPYLIFAPTDQAWQLTSANVSNQTVLLDVLSYHILSGNFTGATSVYPNTTLGQTFLNDSSIVQLEGNKSQAVAWAIRADNTTHVLNQPNDTTVLNVTTYQNLTFAVIDHVLHFPGTLNDTLESNPGSVGAFSEVLKSGQLDFYNSTTQQNSDITFFDAFSEGYSGFTLFSPLNTSVTADNETIQSLLASDRGQFNAVLFNHLINGTTLYSPFLTGSQNYTSQAGQNFSFSVNSTGQYVTQGNVTARIVQPDVLLKNGVIHVIDQVLLDTNADGAAAASALSSVQAAVSSAATVVPTGPIGYSVTAASLTSASTSSPSVTASASTSTVSSVSTATSTSSDVTTTKVSTSASSVSTASGSSTTSGSVAVTTSSVTGTTSVTTAVTSTSTATSTTS